ncbi:hypothetical protein ICW40_01930 [Actinotalea ferrariae]|uniref:hypothetical protein n=1 Tax=Actinotalea ferrariae TaxID=1386098 RepID=UPI001C8CB8E8|nr:hypothetical protein [Actinotalea ferrariae]MBX9243563.1 hypothetical protein [Actinotalea ferrariae]
MGDDATAGTDPERVEQLTALRDAALAAGEAAEAAAEVADRAARSVEAAITGQAPDPDDGRFDSGSGVHGHAPGTDAIADAGYGGGGYSGPVGP